MMPDIDGAFRCAICNKPTFDQEGHAPEPIASGGRCCDACYWNRVMPERIIRAAGIPELG